MVKINVGTIEELLVNVADKLKQLTTLDDADVTFDVLGEEDPSVHKYLDEPATNLVMVARCLVDTTNWAVGKYNLFLDVDTGAEVPRLGPFTFHVI